MVDEEHVKRLRQTVEVWNTLRGRAGMLLTASLRRAKGMTIPKIALGYALPRLSSRLLQCWNCYLRFGGWWAYPAG